MSRHTASHGKSHPSVVRDPPPTASGQSLSSVAAAFSRIQLIQPHGSSLHKSRGTHRNTHTDYRRICSMYKNKCTIVLTAFQSLHVWRCLLIIIRMAAMILCNFCSSYAITLAAKSRPCRNAIWQPSPLHLCANDVFASAISSVPEKSKWKQIGQITSELWVFWTQTLRKLETKIKGAEFLSCPAPPRRLSYQYDDWERSFDKCESSGRKMHLPNHKNETLHRRLSELRKRSCPIEVT